MDYAAALTYLDDHASYEKTGRISSPSIDPISRLCAAMGDPQLAQPVIHVTGTNGKGSTAQMITRLLIAQGLTVGTYTSPHLERVNERIRWDGEPISDDDFAEQIAGIAALEGITGVRPTYFEAITAAAFRFFSDVAVDVAVIEVGMLGRWDATNVVEAQVAVITNIAMDHNEFAGPQLEDIAREKAGIIKPGSVVVIGEDDPDLVEIFLAEGGASNLVRGEQFETLDNSLAIGGRSLDIRTPTTIYSDVFLPLHGRYQGDNATLALTAVEAFFAAPLAEDVVHEGLANVTMPGRFEVMGVQPLAIIDGAHNPPGADLCAEVFFGDFQPEGRRVLVVGTLRDAAEMLAALRADEFDAVYACTAPSPRAVSSTNIARSARDMGCAEVYAHDTVEGACAAAMRAAGPDDAVLVAGSLYVAGAARQAIRRFAN
jgi:dihydrofolate synthase/folylpolyglutamate synthase